MKRGHLYTNLIRHFVDGFLMYVRFVDDDLYGWWTDEQTDNALVRLCGNGVGDGGWWWWWCSHVKLSCSDMGTTNISNNWRVQINNSRFKHQRCPQKINYLNNKMPAYSIKSMYNGHNNGVDSFRIVSMVLLFTAKLNNVISIEITIHSFMHYNCCCKLFNIEWPIEKRFDEWIWWFGKIKRRRWPPIVISLYEMGITHAHTIEHAAFTFLVIRQKTNGSDC